MKKDESFVPGFSERQIIALEDSGYPGGSDQKIAKELRRAYARIKELEIESKVQMIRLEAVEVVMNQQAGIIDRLFSRIGNL